jgi:hypothetical protein
MGHPAREGSIMSVNEWVSRIDEVDEYIAIAEHPEALA